MGTRGFSGLTALMMGAALLLPACVPNGGGPPPVTTTTTTTTTTIPSGAQTATIVYSGPKGNCDLEKVMVGARIRPCQGLANTTTSVIVTSKVLDANCVDFNAYFPITTVLGTAKQGVAPAHALVQTDTTPGTPVFDTGFNVDNGPITVTITNLTVNTSNLVCGWFG